MSKSKILLLWWIFTLVWIFNFSSAIIVQKNEQIDCTAWNPTQNVCTPSKIKQFSSPTKVTLKSLNNAFVEVDVVFFSWWYTSPNVTDSVIYEWVKTIQVNWNFNSNTSLLITYDVEEPDIIIPWWFSNFTPVVAWLGVTVTEIVPYVVYISIWFLIAVLWFFSIKWLCNWFLVKINSVFKSKRW